MDRKEMQDLFKATAAINTPEGLMAYKAFAHRFYLSLLLFFRNFVMQTLLEILGAYLCLVLP